MTAPFDPEAAAREEDRRAFHQAAMMVYVTILPMFTASHDGAPLAIRSEIRRALNRAYAAGVEAERARIADLADDLGRDIERHGRSGDAVKAALIKGGVAAYRSFAETLRALRAPEPPRE